MSINSCRQQKASVCSPIYSFLSIDESVNNSSGWNNVSIVETINESVFESNKQKQHLSGNLVLINLF